MTLETLPQAFSSFASLSWRAAWLVLALLVVRRLVRGRIPAQVWYGVWLVVALRLLVPFSLPVDWSPFNWTATPRIAPTVDEGAMHVDIASSTPGGRAMEYRDLATPVAVPVGSALPQSPAGDRWRSGDALAVLWLAGVAVLLALRVLQGARFQSALRRNRQPADSRLQGAVSSEAVRLDVQAPSCVETCLVDAPALFGTFRPVLLFPVGFAERFGGEGLRFVVRHELGHAHRRDILTQSVMHVAVAMHWFNPMIWIAARLARTDCELACDEYVLRKESTEGAAAYGETLLKVLAAAGTPRGGPAVGIVEGRQQLVTRLKLIMADPIWTWRRIAVGVAIVMLIAVVSVTRESRADDGRAPAAPVPARSGATPNLAAIADEQREVEDLARKLQAYKQEHRLGNVDERRDLLAEAERAASREVEQATQALATADLRSNQIKAARTRGTDLMDLSFIAEQATIAAFSRQLEDVKLALGELSKRYGDRHPRIVDLTARKDALTEELRGEIESVCRRIDAERNMAAAQLSAAQARLDKCRQDEEVFTQATAEFEALSRATRTHEQMLSALIATAGAGRSPLPPTQFEFRNMIVNLAGTSGTRYLKTSFVVSGRDGDLATVFATRQAELTDATLDVLSRFTVADINTPEARSVARERLVSAYNHAIGRDLAQNVYFSDFVVQ